MQIRDIITLVETNLTRPTLPQVKAEIAQRLEDDNLGSDEYQDLLRQESILDEMTFDSKGNLKIYREMRVPVEGIKGAQPGQSLGAKWTYDQTMADADDLHNPKHLVLLIEAVLPAIFVDWDSIYALRGRGGGEVLLDEGDSILVSRIWINGKEYRLPNWNGQMYIA